MVLKKLLTAALLLFVGTSLVVLAVDLVREQSAAGSAAITDPAAADGPAPAKAVVYYFHGNVRCPTCRAIESQAKATVETKFAEELARGDIQWKVLNFEAPENASFVKQFELFTAMVVLADGRSSPATRWKSLDEVWALYDKPAAYQDYIQKELNRFLEEAR